MQTKERTVRIQRLLGAIILVGASSLASGARADNFAIDGDHAWVTFTIRHGIYGVAHGQFDGGVSGQIVMDKADPSKSSVKASIDVGAIHTAYAQRVSDNKGRVSGELTISGVSKEVTLDVTLLNEAPAPWDPKLTKAAFSAKGQLSAADFPMSAAAAKFGLGPEVDVVIDVEAIKK